MITSSRIRMSALSLTLLFLVSWSVAAQDTTFVDYDNDEAAGTNDGVPENTSDNAEGDLASSADGSASESLMLWEVETQSVESTRDKRKPWEWGADRHHSNMTGSTGLLHLAEAGSGGTGTFGIGVHAWYFKYSDYLIAGDENTGMWGNLNLRITPLDFLEIHYGISAAANHNSKEYPGLFQALGDMELGLKGFFSPTDALTLGLDASMFMLNSVGEVALDWAGTSFSFDFLATFDFVEIDDNAPIRAHFKFGYIFDRAANLIEDFERKNGGCGTDGDGDGYVDYQGCLSSVERTALQIDRNDQIRIGLGLDAILPYISPILEYNLEIPVNRQDFICPKDIPGSYDSCMLDEEGTGLRQILTIGARILPPIEDLAIDIGVDIGLTGYAPTVHELAAEVPYRLIIGASYNFDPFPAEIPPPSPVIQPEPVVEVPIPPAILSGLVYDEVSVDQPIPNAVVDYVGMNLNPQVVRKDGKFDSYDLPAGTITLAVSADGYHDATFTVNIPDTGVIEQKFPLKAMPKKGTINVRVVDGDDNSLVGVSVELKGPTKDTLVTDSDGKLSLEVEPGKYTIFASKVDYMSKGIKINAEVNTKTKVQIQLREKPKRSLVVIKKNRIRIKRKIHFEVNADVIKSNSFALLDEIADTLINETAISMVQIQGHTDDRGKHEYNVSLSERRAQSVKRYLVESGVDSGRLEYKGFGPSKPVAPNVTKNGRARNRRVEFHILERN